MSRWQEPIDRRVGRPPRVTPTPLDGVTFEFGILGGVLVDELFVPTSRTRLLIRCERDGEIVVRILEGRSSAT